MKNIFSTEISIFVLVWRLVLWQEKKEVWFTPRQTLVSGKPVIYPLGFLLAVHKYTVLMLTCWCVSAGECCIPSWGNKFMFWLASKRITQKWRPTVKGRGFITVSLQKLCHILLIPNVLINKLSLIYFIWLSQCLIAITFAEDKGHCKDQQQTMPGNVFPTSWSCPPKDSAMILSLFVLCDLLLLLVFFFFFFERNMYLSSVESKARQRPYLI